MQCRSTWVWCIQLGRSERCPCSWRCLSDAAKGGRSCWCSVWRANQTETVEPARPPSARPCGSAGPRDPGGQRGRIKEWKQGRLKIIGGNQTENGQSDKVSDCDNDLPPVYLEQFDSQSCHTQRQLVDLIGEVLTCKHTELVTKYLHTNPTLGPVLVRSPAPKQLDKKAKSCGNH